MPSFALLTDSHAGNVFETERISRTDANITCAASVRSVAAWRAQAPVHQGQSVSLASHLLLVLCNLVYK